MSLIYTDENHRYTLNGKRTTSVTTILGGGIPKQMLPAWYAKQAAEAAWINRDMNDYPEFIRLVKDAPNQARDKAGLRGTDIHNLAEAYLHGEQVSIPAEHVDPVMGFAKFIEDFQVVPLLTEKSVYLKEFNCAGRFDFIGHIAGCDGPVLIDWKTSNGVYPETKLQTAAYASADFYVEPDAPDVELKLPEVVATFVAHITPEGTELHPLARNREEVAEHFAMFRAAHTIYTLGLAKHKILPAIPAPAIEFEEIAS